MQSISREMLGWMKHKLESIARRDINNLGYADDTTLMAESGEELKSLLPTLVFLPGKFHGQRCLVGYTVHGVTQRHD